MKKFFENKKYLIIGVLALELVLLVVNALRFYRHEEISFISDDLILSYYDEATGTTVTEPGFYADHSSKPGSVVYTPDVFLKKGIYSVTIDCSSNGGTWHTNYSTLLASGDPTAAQSANLVSSDHAAIPSGDTSTSNLSWVHYGTNFTVRMGPETDATGDDLYVLVNSVTITYMAGMTVLHETAKFFFILLLIDLVLFLYLFKKKETAEYLNKKAYVIAGMIFIIFFSSFMLFYRKIYFGDDIFYHLRRIAFLAEGLKSGQFPVKIQSGWDNDYGYAVGVGYGDVFLYPSAILVLLGFSVQFAYKFYIFLMNVLTAWISYHTSRRVSKNDYIALLCAGFFTLNGFRLQAVYTGATVGEYGAYTFLPLVVLGLYDIYTREKKYGYITLAFGIALVVANHVITPYILAFTIPLFCLLLIEKTIKKPVLLDLFKACGLTFLASAFFVVPLLDYFEDMRGNDYSDILWERGHEMVTIFTEVADKSKDSGGWAGIGYGFIAIMALGIAIAISGKFKEKTSVYIRVVLFNAFLFYMCLNNKAYFIFKDRLPGIFEHFAEIQYPWHILDIVAAIAIFILAASLKEITKEEAGKSVALITGAIILMTCIYHGGELYKETSLEANEITMFDKTLLIETSDAEFILPGRDDTLPSRETDMVIRDENTQATASLISRNGLKITAQVDNPTGETVTVEAPLWGYRYYTAKGNGQKLNTYRADSYKLAIDIPAGFSGTITIKFTEPWHWRLAELASLAAFIFWGLKLFRYETLKKA